MTHIADIERVKKTIYEPKYGLHDRVSTLEYEFNSEIKIIKNETKSMKVSIYVIIGFLAEISILLFSIAFRGIK